MENINKEENYWMTVLLYFASFLVGLGIIAEVAFNWHQIPNAVKLTGAIIAMIANAAILIWCIKNEKNVLKQVVACVYGFLIMGVIGLIGQIFQLQSNYANACLLWSTVSWPLFMVAPRLLWLWIPMFFIGMRFYYEPFNDVITMLIGNDMDEQAKNLFFAKSNPFMSVLYILSFYAFFVAYELLMNSKHKNNQMITKPMHFYTGWLMLSIYSGVVSLAHYYPPVAEHLKLYTKYFVPYLVMVLLTFAINYKNNRNSLMPAFFAGTVLEALYVSLYKMTSFNYSFEMCCPVVFIVLMLVYAIKNNMPRLKSFMFVVLLMWFIITFEDRIFEIVPSLIICAMFAYLAYRTQSRRWFNIAVIMAVVRILTYYADVDNLQYMGFYLIGSGLLIIATILGLMKYGRLLWRNTNEK